MIDSLNMTIDRSDINENTDLMGEIGTRIEIDPYNSNELKVEGKLGNLKVVITEMEIKVYGSIAKYLNGDNLETLSLEKLRDAVKKLENELGVPVHKGKIKRVDLAGTFQMKEKPQLYLNKLGWLDDVTRSTFEGTTLYYTKKGERQLRFYDKTREMKRKGQVVNIANLLRYEYTFERKRIRKLFKRDLTVEELQNKEVFNVLLDEWHDVYSSISKIEPTYLDVSFNLLESASDWVILCVCQTDSQVDVLRALKEAFTCRKERRPGDVSRHDRLKRNTQKALERGKLFAKPDDRIEELTALIDECYKKHLI